MKRFKKGHPPALSYITAIKKPIPMQCCQIHEPFEIETLEGVMKAEAGDWLIVGSKGEMWAIKKDIFEATYTVVKD
ncbi:MAG: hypothetical protein IT244_08045 [Bacteroidia bacterium]|nr:hypothetical protein [Bacteroidia bacterium]